MLRIGAIAFLLITISFHLVAQKDSLRSVFAIELNEHVGKLIKIHGEYPSNKISSLTEINFSWKTQKQNSWHSEFNFPSYGFSLIHAQFGNNAVLGQSIGAIPTMRFEKWSGKTRFAIRAGFGLAWFNKPYDAIENPRNLVIGSSFTNMTMARLEMSRPLSEKLRYSFGISYTHCSNAHFRVPNIGANIVALTAGISFSQKEIQPERFGPLLYPQRKWAFGANMITGFHEAAGTIRPVDGAIYPVYGASVFTTHYTPSGHNLYVGMNYYYYMYYHDYIISQELFPPGTDAGKKSQSVVFFVGSEWLYNRFALFIEGGFNIYSPFIKEMNKVWDLPKHGFLYQWTSNKLGYRYYFRKEKKSVQPFIHLAVKTNGGTADFLETGIGILFK